MALSETDVVNSALIKLGADSISSLADNNKQARLANLRYAYIRDEVLRAHPWNWAKKRVGLSLSVTAPVYYFTQAFPLPADFIRLLKTDLDDSDEYKIEGGSILCFATTLNILYIFKNTDTTQWDQLFTEAVAWRLAADLSYPLVQSVTLGQQCWKAYTETLALARSVNAQDSGSVDQVIANDWYNARQ